LRKTTRESWNEHCKYSRTVSREKSLFFFAIDYLFVSLLKKDIDLTIKKPEKNPKNLLAFILFFYS